MLLSFHTHHHASFPFSSTTSTHPSLSPQASSSSPSSPLCKLPLLFHYFPPSLFLLKPPPPVRPSSPQYRLSTPALLCPFTVLITPQFAGYNTTLQSPSSPPLGANNHSASIVFSSLPLPIPTPSPPTYEPIFRCNSFTMLKRQACFRLKSFTLLRTKQNFATVVVSFIEYLPNAIKGILFNAISSALISYRPTTL